MIEALDFEPFTAFQMNDNSQISCIIASNNLELKFIYVGVSEVFFQKEASD